MSTLTQQAPQQTRRIPRRRRAPRGRSSKNVLSPVKVAASGGECLNAADHAVDHEIPLSSQNDAAWTQSEMVLQQHFNDITFEEYKKMVTATAKLGIQSDSQVDMGWYLNEEMSEVLFARDILTEDIDLAAKRLSSGYNNLYNESHNIYFNNEDAYIEFELDDSDKLDYCTDEINLVDFSSSDGSLLPCNISNVNTKDLMVRLQEAINKLNDKNVENEQVQNENFLIKSFENSSLTSLQDLTLENNYYNELNISNESNHADCENAELQSSPQTEPVSYSVKKHASNTDNLKSKIKSKFQSSIVTRRRALMNKEENIRNNKETSMEQAEQNSISESHNINQDENFTLRPYSYLNRQEIVIAKALFEIGIKDSMMKHIYTPDKIKMWVCHIEECERQFPKLCSLKTHLLQHFGVKPFKCDYEGCSWGFYADVKLKRHKETHLKKKNFLCTYPGCNRKFSTAHNLAFHEKRHSRSNRLSCQEVDCSEKFVNKRDLELHMMTHNGSEPSYICSFDDCGKRFYTNNTLMAHRRCHSRSNADITCSWPGCGKIFDHPCRLKTHMRFHTGTKPYACTFKGCKWTFTTASKLKRHQMKHTNDRKFTCDVENCKKSFTRLEHLKDHKLRHDVKQRLWPCNCCSSSFSDKKSLYAHIRKHNKESTVCRKNVEKKAEKKKTTRQKKEFVCSTIQPLRLAIKRVYTKSNANKTETEKTVAVQNTKRKSSRIIKNTVIDVPAFSDTENKGQDSSNASDCPINVKSDFQKQHNPSSLISHEEPANVCTHQCLASNQTVPMQNEAVRVTLKENILSSELQPTSVQMKNNTAGNVGSARTALTRDYVFNLKPNREGLNSNENVSDIVLDVANNEEELFLSDDLMPFVCCQDDISGPPYQIMLLNTGTAEDETRIQDLD